jgi:hypothetical protein
MGQQAPSQSFGRDAGQDIIREFWPEEDPFQVNRHELLKAPKEQLKRRAG